MPQIQTPASASKYIDSLLKRFGYRLLPTWRLRQYEMSKHLRRLFRQVDIRCVIDVGAFTGQYRDFLRRHVGYDGLIVSFEPVSAQVDTLKQRAAADPCWVIWPYALGSETGKRHLNVMEGASLTSFLEPDSQTVKKFDTLNVVNRREEVEIKRLDDVMPALRQLPGFPNAGNTFLKLDTQGYDLEVIKGGVGSLAGIAALQTELSVLPIYKEMPTYIEVMEALKERGFDMTGVFPVSRDSLSRIIEFDCVMINRRIAAERGDAVGKFAAVMKVQDTEVL